MSPIIAAIASRLLKTKKKMLITAPLAMAIATIINKPLQKKKSTAI